MLIPVFQCQAGFRNRVGDEGGGTGVDADKRSWDGDGGIAVPFPIQRVGLKEISLDRGNATHMIYSDISHRRYRDMG